MLDPSAGGRRRRVEMSRREETSSRPQEGVEESCMVVVGQRDVCTGQRPERDC